MLKTIGENVIPCTKAERGIRYYSSFLSHPACRKEKEKLGLKTGFIQVAIGLVFLRSFMIDGLSFMLKYH